MTENTETLENRVKDIEQQLEKLKNSGNWASDVRWDAISIVGVWFGAALMCFAPSALGNINYILAATLFATAGIVKWFYPN
jgi:hypothetical protein